MTKQVETTKVASLKGEPSAETSPKPVSTQLVESKMLETKTRDIQVANSEVLGSDAETTQNNNYGFVSGAPGSNDQSSTTIDGNIITKDLGGGQSLIYDKDTKMGYYTNIVREDGKTYIDMKVIRVNQDGSLEFKDYAQGNWGNDKDPKWPSEQINGAKKDEILNIAGLSFKYKSNLTMSDAGCILTSVAIYLRHEGIDVDPHSILQLAQQKNAFVGNNNANLTRKGMESIGQKYGLLYQRNSTEDYTLEELGNDIENRVRQGDLTMVRINDKHTMVINGMRIDADTMKATRYFVSDPGTGAWANNDQHYIDASTHRYYNSANTTMNGWIITATSYYTK
jgi:hypothetical protein